MFCSEKPEQEDVVIHPAGPPGAPTATEQQAPAAAAGGLGWRMLVTIGIVLVVVVAMLIFLMR